MGKEMISRFIGVLVLYFTVMGKLAIASSSEGFEIDCNNLQIAVFYNSAVNYPSAQDVVIRNPSMLLYDLIEISLNNCNGGNGAHKRYVFEYDVSSDDKEYLTLKLVNDNEQIFLYDDLASSKLKNQILDLFRTQEILISPGTSEKSIWVSSEAQKCDGCKFSFGAFPSDQARRYCFKDSPAKGFKKITRGNISQLIGTLQ